MMTKGDTIAEIMSLNPSADPGFLAEFANQELDDYLRRLKQATRSRNPVEYELAGDLCDDDSRPAHNRPHDC